LAVTKAQKVEN